MVDQVVSVVLGLSNHYTTHITTHLAEKRIYWILTSNETGREVDRGDLSLDKWREKLLDSIEGFR